jgi:hypothetical protein
MGPTQVQLIIHQIEHLYKACNIKTGFHEAIGDVLALSVATPKHMAKLGYLDSEELNPETTENFLMSKALEKVFILYSQNKF